METSRRPGSSETDAHLSDDALTALVVDHETPSDDRHHLARCATCRAAFDATVAAFGGLGAALAEGADARLSPTRLGRQTAAIVRRLQGESAPARVLRFPSPSRVFDARHAAARRWVAAAAVAGLFVGLVAGRVLDPSALVRSLAFDQSASTPAFAPAGLADIGLSPAGLADEALLVEVDAAMHAPRIEPLATLDAMTPRAQDLPPGH